MVFALSFRVECSITLCPLINNSFRFCSLRRQKLTSEFCLVLCREILQEIWREILQGISGTHTMKGLKISGKVGSAEWFFIGHFASQSIICSCANFALQTYQPQAFIALAKWDLTVQAMWKSMPHHWEHCKRCYHLRWTYVVLGPK